MAASLRILIDKQKRFCSVRIDTQGLQLSKIFSYLEDIKKKCNIEEYSIAQITLEQVYLHLLEEVIRIDL